MSQTLLIDLNRGVEVRKHKASGMSVYMYRDTPGVYLNAFAKEVPEKLAAEAGFPIKEYAKRRTAKERLANAMDAIEAELAITGETRKILASRGGYEVLAVGLGRARILDDDGNSLTEEPMAEDYALKLLTELAGPAVDTPEAKGQNKPTSNENNKEKANGRTAS